jgi:GDP/UDP-N,N'-diacetylbacillosamine 2-epimerase (hydrolysing)
MKSIVVCVGCRSDAGLSLPIIRRLKEQDWCKVYNCKLEPMDYIASYQKVDYLCRAEKHIGNHNAQKPNLCFLTGDRVEMCAAAAAAFHNGIPIAHYYGGVINDPITTYDDIDRHVITLWSDIQFVESEDAAGVVWDLKHSVGLKSNAHVVGISHLDDLYVDDVEEELIPDVPYDLILYNTPTKTDSEKEIKEFIEWLKYDKEQFGERYIILISSNPDGDMDKLLLPYVDRIITHLPRSQFLGLLKHCNQFISNSSAAIYEAPYFLKPDQIVMIGDRNRNRPQVSCVPGASDKIVRILKEYLK